MKRSIILSYLRSAGYHNDSKLWARTYTENRVALSVAKAEWSKGAEMRQSGVPCACYDCNKREKGEAIESN